MNRPSFLLAALGAAAALAACNGTVTRGLAGGASGGASSTSTGGATSTSTGGATSTSSGTAGGGGAPNCATCTAGERCDVVNPCIEAPSPYTCVPCDHRPYCGSNGQVFDSDCAAIAAGAGAGGGTCPTPAGRYACGAYYCDAASEDCTAYCAIPSCGYTEVRCVPCAGTSGRACGDDGKVYPSACAMLQAGHHGGWACPGFVGCGAFLCDTTVASCRMGLAGDCEGGSPVYTCQPGTDGGG